MAAPRLAAHPLVPARHPSDDLSTSPPTAWQPDAADRRYVYEALGCLVAGSPHPDRPEYFSQPGAFLPSRARPFLSPHFLDCHRAHLDPLPANQHFQRLQDHDLVCCVHQRIRCISTHPLANQASNRCLVWGRYLCFRTLSFRGSKRSSRSFAVGSHSDHASLLFAGPQHWKCFLWLLQLD